LSQATVTVAAGADGQTALYEDNGTDASHSAATTIRYAGQQLTIEPSTSPQPGRQWTVVFANANAPSSVTVNALAVSTWTYDSAKRTITVTTPRQPTSQGLVVAYR
jgi:hypothetical protein